MAARDVEFRQDTPGRKAWFSAEWLDQWRGLESAPADTNTSCIRGTSPERVRYAFGEQRKARHGVPSQSLPTEPDRRAAHAGEQVRFDGSARRGDRANPRRLNRHARCR